MTSLTDNKLHARWLPANQAFVTFFGDSECSVDGVTIHPNYKELVANCRACKLMPVNVGRGHYLIQPLSDMRGGDNG